MTFHVRLFAGARDLAGASVVVLDLPAAATVADLRRTLVAMHPAMAALVERSAVAINNDFADDQHVLPADAEVALLPPVSGG
jgi:molybdopterin converting factor subunit 1